MDHTRAVRARPLRCPIVIPFRPPRPSSFFTRLKFRGVEASWRFNCLNVHSPLIARLLWRTGTAPTQRESRPDSGEPASLFLGRTLCDRTAQLVHERSNYFQHPVRLVRDAMPWTVLIGNGHLRSRYCLLMGVFDGDGGEVYWWWTGLLWRLVISVDEIDSQCCFVIMFWFVDYLWTGLGLRTKIDVSMTTFYCICIRFTNE